jgi:PAS domain S-box-containing protein
MRSDNLPPPTPKNRTGRGRPRDRGAGSKGPKARLKPRGSLLLTLDATGRIVRAPPGAGRFSVAQYRNLEGLPIQQVFPDIDFRDLAPLADPDGVRRPAYGRTPLNKYEKRINKNEIRGAPPARGALRHVLVLACRCGPADGTAARLREQTRRLAAIVEEAEDGIISVDAELRIRLFNRGAEKIFGYRAEEVLGEPLNLLIPERFRAMHDRHVHGFAAGDERARKMGERREIISLRKGGEEFPAEASILKQEYGGEATYAVILRDTTVRKREEEALRVAKTEAEVASQTKSRFLASMSHELRTPLNAIIGFSQLMLRHVHGPLGDPSYDGYVANILEGGEILLSLINDILDMSKIEAGKMELDLSEVAIADAVDSAIRILGQRAASGRLRLSREIPAGLPPIRADLRMLQQMLLNLISNAIKFTPEGGNIVVRADCGPEGEIAVSVQDTGIGIAEKDIPRALEPFGQIPGPRARHHPGTGLGLAIVNSMSRLHGGTLAIESRVGSGTTATIRFPAALVIRAGTAACCGKDHELCHGCTERTLTPAPAPDDTPRIPDAAPREPIE